MPTPAPHPLDRLSTREAIEFVLQNHAASFWLKDALNKALSRDPVDALGDANVLTYLLRRRCDDILGQSSTGPGHSGSD